MDLPSVQASVAALAASDIGARNGKLGKLRWRSGVRISASDARVGDVRGLELDARYGFIAVTARGDWLTFDPPRAIGNSPMSLGVAPIAQMPGSPEGLINDPYGFLTVRFSGVGHRSYALRHCGAAAQPIKDANVGSMLMERVRTRTPDRPGWQLRDISEADRFMPDLRPGLQDAFLLWRQLDSGVTILEELIDTPDASSGPKVLARFDRPIDGMTTYFNDDEVLVFVILQAPGAVDLHTFSLPSSAR